MNSYEISVRRLWPLLAGLVAAGVIIGGLVYALVSAAAQAPAAEAPVVELPPAGQGEKHEDVPPTDANLRPKTIEVNTAEPPVPFHEGPQGQTIMKVFGLLAQGKSTPQEHEPVPDLWTMVERNLPNRVIPSGMKDFYDGVMVKGPWQAVGRPMSSVPLAQPTSERGRTVESRYVYLLIQQGDQWMQAKVLVEFLSYPDGRTLVAQGTLAVSELKILDSALVPKYKAAHGL